MEAEAAERWGGGEGGKGGRCSGWGGGGGGQVEPTDAALRPGMLWLMTRTHLVYSECAFSFLPFL